MMTTELQKKKGSMKWEISEHVRWAVQTDGLYVIHTRTMSSQKLEYPDAAVWDLITRYGSNRKIIQLLSHIANLSLQKTELIFSDCMGRWASSGLLTMDDGNG